MFKFFRAIDSFLTDCEEYIEQRVWNGKFINDLKFISETERDNLKESYKKKKKKIQESPTYQSFEAFVLHLWGIMMKIPVFADSVWLLTTWVRIAIKYIAHYIIVLLAALMSASILLDVFQKSPIVFSLFFVVIVLINHLLLTTFFILVDKREHGSKNAIAETEAQLLQTLSENSFLYLLQLSITLSLGTFLLGFSSLLSFIFSEIHIDWSNSFFYWMPVVMVGLLLLIVLYLVTLIIVFAYIFVVLDKKKIPEAINLSWHYLQNDPKHSTMFYALLTVASFLYIVNSIANNFEGGFAVSVLFSSQAFLIMGFLLRKKYYLKEINPPVNIFSKYHPPIIPLIGIGLLSYIAFTTFVVQIHPSVMNMLAARHQKASVKFKFNIYTNTDSGYTISYPRTWSAYRWSNHSVTFYTNDSGTDVGGVKVDIDVHPEAGSKYLELYEANPGLVIYDTATKNVTTKIANVSVDGENAVKYTYLIIEGKQTEYQTHFLVHHKKQIYDIAFKTKSKNSEEVNRELFEEMMKTFKFTGQK